MYTLYWSKGTASMVCHALLNEIGVPYKMVEIDQDKNEHKSPEYLKINPNGRVPALSEDGRIMYESAAIVLHLCESHPASGLMPTVGSPTRPAFLQWLFFLTNTVQETLMHWWRPENFLDDDEQRKALVAIAERRLARMWQQLDGALGNGGPYLLGGRVSAVDLFLVMLARWSRNTKKPARSFPRIGRLMELVEARPAYRRMMTDEGLA